MSEWLKCILKDKTSKRIQRSKFCNIKLKNLETFKQILYNFLNSRSRYLSLRASLLAPEMLSLLAKFHATSAVWLLQVNMDEVGSEESKRSTYAPGEFRTVTLPLPETVPVTLRCIPEFVVENTVRFLHFLRRSNPNTFEEQGPSFLNPVLTEVSSMLRDGLRKPTNEEQFN